MVLQGFLEVLRKLKSLSKAIKQRFTRLQDTFRRKQGNDQEDAELARDKTLTRFERKFGACELVDLAEMIYPRNI